MRHQLQFMNSEAGYEWNMMHFCKSLSEKCAIFNTLTYSVLNRLLWPTSLFLLRAPLIKIPPILDCGSQNDSQEWLRRIFRNDSEQQILSDLQPKRAKWFFKQCKIVSTLLLLFKNNYALLINCSNSCVTIEFSNDKEAGQLNRNFRIFKLQSRLTYQWAIWFFLFFLLKYSSLWVFCPTAP